MPLMEAFHRPTEPLPPGMSLLSMRRRRTRTCSNLRSPLHPLHHSLDLQTPKCHTSSNCHIIFRTLATTFRQTADLPPILSLHSSHTLPQCITTIIIVCKCLHRLHRFSLLHDCSTVLRWLTNTPLALITRWPWAMVYLHTTHNPAMCAITPMDRNFLTLLTVVLR